MFLDEKQYTILVMFYMVKVMGYNSLQRTFRALYGPFGSSWVTTAYIGNGLVRSNTVNRPWVWESKGRMPELASTMGLLVASAAQRVILVG